MRGARVVLVLVVVIVLVLVRRTRLRIEGEDAAFRLEDELLLGGPEACKVGSDRRVGPPFERESGGLAPPFPARDGARAPYPACAQPDSAYSLNSYMQNNLREGAD